MAKRKNFFSEKKQRKVFKRRLDDLQRRPEFDIDGLGFLKEIQKEKIEAIEVGMDFNKPLPPEKEALFKNVMTMGFIGAGKIPAVDRMVFEGLAQRHRESIMKNIEKENEIL